MKIEFSTDNDAFVGPYENDPISKKFYKECMVIKTLKDIIYKIETEENYHGTILDDNGNKIGYWEM